MREHKRVHVLVPLVVLSLACGGGGGGGHGGPQKGTAQVGPAGGTVSVDGGPVLTVPPSALAATVTLTVQQSSAAAPAGARSALYEFGPAGTTFDRDVTVEFPAPADGSTDVAVYWTKAGSTTAYDVLPATVAGGKVTASVRHFSSGFVGPRCVEAESCALDRGCHLGVRQCSTGVPVCADGGNAPDGTACTGGVCSAGTCVPGLLWDQGTWDQASWN